MMSCYHNNPEATRDAFDSEGWFKTGDVAIYNEDGFFSIVDRIKELIKVKGLQVSPSELEEILLSYPGVAEVGVVGVADKKAGEVPRAYIVPRENSLKKDDLHAFIASRVAPHKQLAGGIEFVDQLPKNPTGKLLRKELKKMAHGE
ncbi:putative acyl-coenzyme A synthetase [Portunus trituberculatus]|uniref:Putative acyl-coenzyme A synthetase n=1 Tax=Portunus trituberculatus TaxID=210409 RepID=A0A5B7CMV5_PORTR|nr:putative acyl-coenzyme A synthetase [Portunus trituberculatus]